MRQIKVLPDKTIDLIFFVLLTIVLCCYFFNVGITSLALMLISVLYIMFTFSALVDSLFRANFSIGFKIIISLIRIFTITIVIGILIRLLFWSATNYVFIAGSIIGYAIFIVYYINKSKFVKIEKTTLVYTLKKCCILIIISFLGLFFNSKLLINHKHSEDPEVARLRYENLIDPKNDVKKKALEDYCSLKGIE
jgi:O-antigen/teichoic acid export membrane protein